MYDRRSSSRIRRSQGVNSSLAWTTGPRNHGSDVPFLSSSCVPEYGAERGAIFRDGRLYGHPDDSSQNFVKGRGINRHEGR
jgi:hypothetical protein